MPRRAWSGGCKPHSARLLLHNPRLGSRLAQFDPREVRRVFVGDYELRHELLGDTILIANLWHTRESR
jgi:hypothetical protein